MTATGEIFKGSYNQGAWKVTTEGYKVFYEAMKKIDCMDNKKKTEILRQEESWQLLSSIEDLRTNQLLNKATMCIIRAYTTTKEPPVSSFDLRFFAEAMLEFCSDHENLKRILAGEDLRWFGNDGIENPNFNE